MKSLNINKAKESPTSSVKCQSKLYACECILYGLFHHTLGGPGLKNLTVNIVEGTENASFDLGFHDVSLTSTISLRHTITSHSNDVQLSIRNATVLFKNITRDHAGTYLLNLTHPCVHDDIVENRTEVGNLTLNVLCELLVPYIMPCNIIIMTLLCRWPRNEKWFQ